MPRIVQRGQGAPIVVVPGIQGRWEWMAPTVDEIATYGRAITYSLCDEPSSEFAWQPQRGFDNYLDQLDDVLSATGSRRPVLVGISYGGLIAAEYVARHPGRAAGLVIASAPPPTRRPDTRAGRYLGAPHLMAPAFLLGAPMRVYPELKAAIPHGWDRWHFALVHGLRVVGAPPSPARMARRLRWLQAARFALDHPLDVPALIVTGEPELEHVVPPALTEEYLTWLPRAQVVRLSGTGHAGTVTKSREFAALVNDFSTGAAHAVAV